MVFAISMLVNTFPSTTVTNNGSPNCIARVATVLSVMTGFANEKEYNGAMLAGFKDTTGGGLVVVVVVTTLITFSGSR